LTLAKSRDQSQKSTFRTKGALHVMNKHNNFNRF